MKTILKISGWTIFYLILLLLIFIIFLAYWSYGEKKKIPSTMVSEIENIFEDTGNNLKMFIGGADIQYTGISEGFVINLSNCYMNFGNNIYASAPEIKIRLKASDLLLGRISFREINIEKPKFVIAGNIDAENFSESVSVGFFNMYKNLIYHLFDKIDKDKNAIPIEKIDLNDAEFSFNKQGNYETWNIKEANLRFFILQNTTYLSTYVNSKLFGEETEVTVNARLLDKDRALLKFEYKNLDSHLLSSFVKGLDWFNEMKPILDGTSSLVMNRSGQASSISLDTDIRYRKKEVENTRIGFKGALDLVESQNKLKPKLHGEVFLKDIDMTKLSDLWPDKYGKEVRADVLKNYTKGTFKNVYIYFDYIFSDPEFTDIESEKYSISGDIVNTDVIYNHEFPAIEKVDGNFIYGSNSIFVKMDKGSIGNLNFGPSKIMIKGLNDPKTILEISGTAKGDITSLRPLLKSILKNRDQGFFYNTRNIKADSDIKFYYRDNINNGFDPEVVKMDIKTDLSNVEINDVVKGVNLSAKKLDMNLTDKGLSLKGDVMLNGSSSQLDSFIGFINENDIHLNVTSETNSEVLDKLLPGLAKYVDGNLEVQFEYKSLADRNYFAGKIDSADANISFPYLSWQKPKGKFASISLGGKYNENKAIEVSELQIISDKTISTGNMLISLNDNIADEIYFNNLKLDDNDAEVYFSRSHLTDKETKNKYESYIIKVNGKSFNASKIIDSFHHLASGNNALILDLAVDKLTLSNNVNFLSTKAFLRCGQVKCSQGNFDANIESGGKISAIYYPQDKNKIAGVRNFNIKSDNAGEVVKAMGISDNINGGNMSVSGKVGEDKINEANGEILINDFKLTKAPILTKLLSLASFTGILNLLSNSGIPMKKLKGDFKMKNDYISVTNLKAYGDSLGFTTQGNINLDNAEVDLSGAVTPSYSVNTMFSKVPLIGELFRGKEGEGLIATNYSVKGKYPDVDVSVNPLSALTPGFLRNIWGEAETDIDKKTQQGPMPAKKFNFNNKDNKGGFKVNTKPAVDQ